MLLSLSNSMRLSPIRHRELAMSGYRGDRSMRANLPPLHLRATVPRTTCNGKRTAPPVEGRLAHLDICAIDCHHADASNPTQASLTRAASAGVSASNIGSDSSSPAHAVAPGKALESPPYGGWAGTAGE